MFSLLFVFGCSSGALRAVAADSSFGDAQQAAAKGDYKNVVLVLSDILSDPNLEPDQIVVAYANRGIAYSLLKAYALAKRDLENALTINPAHPLTLNHLGLLAEQVDLDYDLAAGFYSKANESQFPPSQVNLANLYWFGYGVPRNPQRAFELYQKAAESEYNMAYVPLGRVYASGDGAPQDNRRAFELFLKASETGVATSNYYLGFAYEKGRGVKQDTGLAKKYYQIAAMQGHGEAQNALGYLYRRGLGVPQDYTQASVWYQLSADQGIPGAMNRLSWLLAGCPNEKICDGNTAVQLAKMAIEIEKTPERLDSLAAGYARLGRFDDAINTMSELLAALSEKSSKRAGYQRRLEQYQQGIAMQL